jgi:hypothetical protein
MTTHPNTDRRYSDCRGAACCAPTCPGHSVLSSFISHQRDFPRPVDAR